MSAGLIWSDILAYSLQIGLLVAVGALVPAVLRVRMPRARLLFWQILLIACLALPWVRAWRQEVVAGTIQMSGAITAAAPAPAPVRRTIPFTAIALWLLAAGAAVRLGLLAAGLVRLAAYRRRGKGLPLELRMPGAITSATLLMSEDVAGPVTFGWRDPVVLLPASFLSLRAEMRDAIVCHELLHVERRDWLFTIAEELVRAVLWFHPAIWWVIGEIQLAREQTVDQSVVGMTQARGPYVDTLLLIAGAPGAGTRSQPDLAPGMFPRRRHLKRRLIEVMNEVRMTTISKTRLACVMSAAVVMVAVACWLAAGAFPLAAAPQVVDDAAGVAVNMNGSQLMHRSPVAYPVAALEKGIEGTVVVQVKLDAAGEVSDAAVLSGPDELRKSVLQSVLNWHFDKSAAFTTRTVNIDFVKPANAASPVAASAAFSRARMPEQMTASNGGNMAPAPPLPPSAPALSGKLEHIVVTGLSDSARGELLSSLPIQEGSSWSGSGQEFAAVRTAVNKFDSHLTVGLGRSGGGYSLYIGVPNNGLNVLPAAAAPLPSGVYSVGNGITAPVLLSNVQPEYTEQARAAKYSGTVTLSVIVKADGTADNVQIVRSLGMGLDEKAVECVQKWLFRPGMNQGVPVNVRAQIEVNFRLL